MPAPFQFAEGPSPSELSYRHVSSTKQRIHLAFNHEIEFVAPLDSIPDDFPSIKPIVYTVRVPLASLLSPDFLQNYICQGEFSALSIDSKIDSGNVVAFLPNGSLMLAVDSETYESLGLIGRPSKFKSLKSTRYDIIVDLRSVDFRQGSAQYQRLLWCLQDRTEPCSLIATYTRDGRPENINFPPDAISNRIETSSLSLNVGPFPIPAWFNQELDTNLSNEAKLELFHWFGAISCSCSNLLQSCGQTSDSYASSFALHQLTFSNESKTCTKRRLTGLIPESVIEEWISYAESLVISKACTWAAITIFGFSDAPVSWARRRDDSGFSSHHYEYAGDNHYVLIFLPDCSCVQFLAAGGLDNTH